MPVSLPIKSRAPSNSATAFPGPRWARSCAAPSGKRKSANTRTKPDSGEKADTSHLRLSDRRGSRSPQPQRMPSGTRRFSDFHIPADNKPGMIFYPCPAVLYMTAMTSLCPAIPARTDTSASFRGQFLTDPGDRIFLSDRRAACTVLRNPFSGGHTISGCDLYTARFIPGFLPH